MPEEPEPRVERDGGVVCSGPAEAPHPPRYLALPAEGTVICADCGRRYCAEPAWRLLAHANWPKAK